MIRVDYIHEGLDGLGLAVQYRAPLAFLSREDRAAIMGPGFEWALGVLPDALALSDVGRALEGEL